MTIQSKPQNGLNSAERRSNKNTPVPPSDIMETKENLLFQKQQSALMNNFAEIKRLNLIARMNNIDIGEER